MAGGGHTRADAARRLDFFPASAGRRNAAFVEGDVIGAELVYYPSPHPLRAQIVTRIDEEGTDAVKMGIAPADRRAADTDPMAAYARALGREPWLTEVPLTLPEGRLVTADEGAIWWQGAGPALPAMGQVCPLWRLACRCCGGQCCGMVTLVQCCKEIPS